MALTVPTLFGNDIQARDTNLIPVVIIGNYEIAEGTSGFGPINDGNWLENSLHISTNDFTHPKVSSPFTEYGAVGSHRFSPILLNIPSLKESIDIEKRNYKISNITLDISNMPFNGVRFSELFEDTSLINTEVRIFWWSSSTSWLSPYTVPASVAYALMVYNGKIRRYTHDDEKVKLEVEDRSQATLHKDLPLPDQYNDDGVLIKQNWLGTDDTVPDKSKNKPIPMVYGRVDKSPVLFNNNYRELVAESTDVVFGWTTGKFGVRFPLWMDVGTHLINVHSSNQYSFDRGTKIPFTANFAANYEGTGEGEGFVSPDDVSLICLDDSKNYQVSLSNTMQDPTATTEDFEQPAGSIAGMSDGSYAYNEVDWLGYRIINPDGTALQQTSEFVSDIILFHDNNNGNLTIDFRTVWRLWYSGVDGAYWEALLLKLNFNYIPSYDIQGDIILTKMKINDRGMTTILPSAGVFNGGRNVIILQSHYINPSFYMKGDLIWDISEWYYDYDVYKDLVNHESIPGDIESLFSFPNAANNYGYYPDAAIQMRSEAGAGYDGISDQQIIYLRLRDGNISSFIDEVDIQRKVEVIKIFEKDYYATVNGRLLRDDLNYDAAAVIGDILENELGVVGAGGQSAAPYTNWLYSFTVNKKTNSKKLIEGIASASPFIPRFDYLGNFKFDVIPETIGADGSLDSWIDSNSVISFKCSRTKIEDVYTRVQLNYKWIQCF